MPALDAVIIGAGHNGLVAAFYLARAGLSTLVLERRDVVGGAAVTGEIAPGFRCPVVAHAAGPLRPSIAADMGLDRHGVVMTHPDPRVIALTPGEPALLFHDDVARTAKGLVARSARDAERYPEFASMLTSLAGFLRPLLEAAPPSPGRRGGRDLWAWLRAGRRFRQLGRERAFELLRYLPMAVADLVDDWFESDALKGAVAARGIFGTVLGPMGAGTAAHLLLQAATDPMPAGGGGLVRGGPGAMTTAMAVAVRQAGSTIRTGADVARVDVGDGRATGVVLATGERIEARAVASSADPRHTFLRLLEPSVLDPEFADAIRHYRMSGTVAKVNLALDGLPDFQGLARSGGTAGHLAGRLLVAPSVMYLQRAADAAKYGRISDDPYLDLTVPSLADPSLAPEGGHVMSVYAQYSPYNLRDGDWTVARDTLAARVIDTLARHAPGLPDRIRHVQVVTPKDLEVTYGMTGGHPFHGEPALDQLFVSRPVYGWAQYRTPVEGLYLCGAGAHPGGGLTGGPGANAAREILRDLGVPLGAR